MSRITKEEKNAIKLIKQEGDHDFEEETDKAYDNSDALNVKSEQQLPIPIAEIVKIELQKALSGIDFSTIIGQKHELKRSDKPSVVNKSAKMGGKDKALPIESAILEQFVIELMALGMATPDIIMAANKKYGVNVSTQFINIISNKIINEAINWKNQPLDSTYPFVFLSSQAIKRRIDGICETLHIHLVFSVSITGIRDILGFYFSRLDAIGEGNSILSDLKARGVQKILQINCRESQSLRKTISTLFPKCDVQTFVLEKLSQSCRFLPPLETYKFKNDIRLVYEAENFQSSLLKISELKDTWKEEFERPIFVGESAKNELENYFKLPYELRQINKVLRTVDSIVLPIKKITSKKGVFMLNDELLKLVYLNVRNFINRKRAVAFQKGPKMLHELEKYYGVNFDDFEG